VTEGAAVTGRAERADLRRGQIVTHARELFGERSTTEVSMDEIAARSGVARSTVYVYFANRSELLVACIEDLYDQLRASLDGHEGGAAPERFVRLVTALLSTIDLQPSFFQLALATQSAPNPAGEAVSARLSGIGVDIAASLHQILVDGTSAGHWNVTAPDRTSILIGQQLYGALAVRSMDPTPPPATVTAEELTSFITYGLTR